MEKLFIFLIFFFKNFYFIDWIFFFDSNKPKTKLPPFADPKISATTKKAIIGELTRPDAADDASGKILFFHEWKL